MTTNIDQNLKYYKYSFPCTQVHSLGGKNARAHARAHTHTHTHIYIYIYMHAHAQHTRRHTSTHTHVEKGYVYSYANLNRYVFSAFLKEIKDGE